MVVPTITVSLSSRGGDWEVDVFWGIIHRMIVIDMIKVFAISLIALTGLILMAGVVSEAMRHGLGPVQILAIIPMMLPSLLPYTVPTTTLFTTCIVYGRLSAHNEILALKASGVHVAHVVWPAIFLGSVMSITTFVLYLDVIPYTGYLLRNHTNFDLEEILYSQLRKDGHLQNSKINFEIVVDRVQGRKLINAMFMRRSADGKTIDLVIMAKEAELRVATIHNKILVDMRGCTIIGEKTEELLLESKIWEIDINGDMNGPTAKFRAADMTWLELSVYQHKWEEDRDALADKIAKALSETPPPQHDSDPLLRKLRGDLAGRQRQINSIFSERHMRPALALGCLCFTLVGCPVGIWLSKSDYLSAFISCFVPIVLVYYPLMLGMLNIATAGIVPAVLVIYNANLLLLSVGLLLFWRLARN
jgi:lipopolysaccharide export system permease protein